MVELHCIPPLTLTLTLKPKPEQVQATFLNKDVEGASLWFDGKQQWMDGDWKVGHVRTAERCVLHEACRVPSCCTHPTKQSLCMYL